jgi:hypothetical protein
MASIPIHNETDYPLTDDMTQYIIRDAQEHFGEEVRAIRVQSGLARHAFNARTREVRYAFFPQDFGSGQTMPTVQEPFDHLAPLPHIDTEPEEAILPASFEDIEVEEDLEPLETSLESLDEGPDDEEEEDDDGFKLDDPVEDADEDEEDNLFDDEDEED